jgi:hypothetical protein
MEPQEEQVLIHIRGTLYFVHNLTLAYNKYCDFGIEFSNNKNISFSIKTEVTRSYTQESYHSQRLRRKNYLSAVVPQSPVVRTYYLVVLNHQLGLGLAYIQLISIRVITTITYKVKFNFWKL